MNKERCVIIMPVVCLCRLDCSCFIISGKRPFVCDICGSAFSQRASLRTHISSVHEGKSSYGKVIFLLSLHNSANFFEL